MEIMLKIICFFLYVGYEYESFLYHKGEYVSKSITCREAWVLADIATNQKFKSGRKAK